MYKCKHFKIYELVPPQVFKDRGQKAWELLDPNLLMLIDRIKMYFSPDDPVTINDWKWGGKFKWSGLRNPQARKYYSPTSQHTFGRAADMKFKNITPKKIRTIIRDDPSYWDEMGVRCVENKTGTWLHVDVRNCIPIKWVNP
ncbi:MAG: hypothetical protein KAQ85_10285 [Thermodesulfovibrionia bacterium]|jgi:uncharacterized protein YcbK (DUF882 family)|nr:hypothetical protein [Thermodesulfovibrionia bacterium]